VQRCIAYSVVANVQLDPRFSWSMYIKTAVILLAVACSAAYAFYIAQSLLVRPNSEACRQSLQHWPFCDRCNPATYLH
jgi:hypothetical protein